MVPGGKPRWVSGHLCETGVHGINLYALQPVPHTKETLIHVVSRISQVQDDLERCFVIENVSSYIPYQGSEMNEWEFVAEIARQFARFGLGAGAAA